MLALCHNGAMAASQYLGSLHEHCEACRAALKYDEHNVYRIRHASHHSAQTDSQSDSSAYGGTGDVGRPLHGSPAAFVLLLGMCSRDEHGCRPTAASAQAQVCSRKDGIPHVAGLTEIPQGTLIDRISNDAEEKRSAWTDQVQYRAGTDGGEDEDAVQYGIGDVGHFRGCHLATAGPEQLRHMSVSGALESASVDLTPTAR